MSGWMALFTSVGFSVTRYQDVFAPEWAIGTRGSVPADWARAYPVEQVWHLTKTA